MDGVNYLVPVDARLERDVDVRFETVTVDGLLVSTTGGEAAANLGSAVRWRTGQVCLAPAAKEGWQRYGGHDVPRPRTILALALCLLTAPAVDLRAQLHGGLRMGGHGPDRPRVDDSTIAEPAAATMC